MNYLCPSFGIIEFMKIIQNLYKVRIIFLGMENVCYVNPTVLLKRPIAELIDRLEGKEKVGLLIPKKLFKEVDKRLHYSEVKKAGVYTYSTVNIPFLNMEWPIPITPMFFINLVSIFFKYKNIHMWTYHYLVNLFVILGNLIFRKKLILTTDTIPGYSFSMGKVFDSLYKCYYFFLSWLMFGVPDVITVYGKSLVPYALKAGVNREKLKVIPTGIELNKFEDVKKGVKEEFDINKDKIMVLFVGLMVPRKGIDLIIKVAKRLKKKAIFVLVGNGPSNEKYEKMAKGIKEMVFTGFRKDVGRFYKAADIFFLPSRGEGLAGVIMEAMTMGLPVVSSRIPCTTDLVEDGKTGFLCEKEDVSCYTDRIEKLVKDKKLRKKMGREGKKKIKEFDWDKVIDEYKGLY